MKPRWSGLAVALLSAACVRSTQDIPPPPEGGFVTGTVLELDPETGALVPVAGAVVAVRGVATTITTRPDGFFQLTRLPLGVLVIDITGPLRATGRSSRRLRGIQALASGQSIDLGPIEISTRGDLEGTTVRLGAAAEGSSVIAAETAFRAVSGLGGEYLLAGLARGAFDVVAFRPGHRPARLTGVEVSAGERKRLAPLDLVPTSEVLAREVRGRALIADQTDHAGIEVQLVPALTTTAAGASLRASTDERGDYRLEAPVGVYRAHFRRAGLRAVTLEGVAVLEDAVLGLPEVRLFAEVAGDLDGDGVPDASDPDRDNDGCPNERDRFPEDPAFCGDLDGDGLADELDPDRDGDGLTDAEESAPGRDGFVTHPERTDTDGDGLADGLDLCPILPVPERADADGDGRGDACDDDESTGPGPGPLTIRGFSPARLGTGQDLVIFGTGFFAARPEVNVVQFGGGAAAAARTVTATQLTLLVPPGARTGPVTVFTGQATATSTAVLEIIDGPDVLRLHPTRVPPGATVQVIGRHLLEPSLEIAILPEGRTLSILERGPGVEVGTEYFRFKVPLDATPGFPQLRVRTHGGERILGGELEVLGAPTILDLSPRIANVGQRVSATGAGFSVDGTGGAVRVRLAGSGEVDPLTVRPDAVEFVVPPGTVTGPVVVVHPAGEATSPVDLTIDPARPALGIPPSTVVYEGLTMRVPGANLHAPPDRTLVALSIGGTPVTSATVTDGAIDLTVPSGVRPGPLVALVRDAQGTEREARAPVQLSVVTQRRVPWIENGVFAGLAFSADGARLHAVADGSNFGRPRGYVLDAETLAPLPPTDGVDLRPFATGNLAFFGIEGTSYGIVAAPGTSGNFRGTFVVRLPTFEPRPCLPDPIQRVVGEPFAPAGTAVAYGLLGGDLARVEVLEDPSTGDFAVACAMVDPPGAPDLDFLLPPRAPDRRVFGLTAGQRATGVLVDLDPGSASYGAVVETHATGLTVSNKVGFAWDPDPSGLQAWGGPVRYDFAAGQALGITGPATVSGTTYSIGSVDLRWLLFDAAGGRYAIADLLRPSVAGVAHGSATAPAPYDGFARHPLRPSFVSADGTGNNVGFGSSIVRIDLEPAPYP